MPKTMMRNGWKRWTEDDLGVLRELARARVPKEIIGLRMGRSPEAVAQRAWLEGLLLGRRRRERTTGEGSRPEHGAAARPTRRAPAASAAVSANAP